MMKKAIIYFPKKLLTDETKNQLVKNCLKMIKKDGYALGNI